MLICTACVTYLPVLAMQIRSDHSVKPVGSTEMEKVPSDETPRGFSNPVEAVQCCAALRQGLPSL